MIIPIRCFTCNNIIGSKYNKYLEIIATRKEDDFMLDSSTDIDGMTETIENIAFKTLHIKRYCCKRHLLTHVDLMDKI
jgi:DNA-directed RNA polymerases I, II, and III subunit RPABC5